MYGTVLGRVINAGLGTAGSYLGGGIVGGVTQTVGNLGGRLFRGEGEQSGTLENSLIEGFKRGGRNAAALYLAHALGVPAEVVRGAYTVSQLYDLAAGVQRGMRNSVLWDDIKNIIGGGAPVPTEQGSNDLSEEKTASLMFSSFSPFLCR